MADAEHIKLDDGSVIDIADAVARQKVGSAELQTTAKDCSGAINELKGTLDNKTDYATVIPTGATSIADAIGKVWDGIGLDKTVIGNFNYQGQFMYMAYKYKVGSAYYGMMLAIRYEAANIYVLNVINDSKGVKTLTIN